MKNHWFYNRLLISYVPIIFSICTILVLLLVIGFNQLSREAAAKESMTIARYIMAEIDNELNSVQQAVNEELLNKGKFMRLFHINPSTHSYQDTYELSVMLRNTKFQNPAIHSLYVYRSADQTIQTMNGTMAMEQFPDQTYLFDAVTNQSPLDEEGWSEVRPFREFNSQDEVNVTTQYRVVPRLGSSGGYLVVNVSTDYLLGIVGHLTDLGATTVSIFDPGGQTLLSAGSEEVKIDATYRSDQSGYTIQLGFREGLLHNMITTITLAYVVIALIVFAIGLLWLLHTTRRTFKPVHAILSKLGSISEQRSAGENGKFDEFGAVEAKLEQLIDYQMRFDTQQREHRMIKRRMFYTELREGYGAGSVEDRQRDLAEFGWEGGEGFMMAVVEIDGFDEFTERFNERDQALLKYAIYQLIIDLSQENMRPQPWADWLSSNQMALLYPVNRNGCQTHQDVSDELNTAVQWISQHLKTTVSIGIGSPVWEVTAIPHAYEEALQMLKFKFTLGHNRIIGFWEVNGMERTRHTEMLAPTRTCIQHVCHPSMAWQSSFDDWFTDLSRWTATREDIGRLMDSLIYYFRLEVSKLSSELSEIWFADYDSRLVQTVQSGRSVAELRDSLYSLLSDIDARFSEVRGEKRHTSVMEEIRDYIDDHYFDPGLSLELLSDKFALNSKTLSRLFKEHFGVKFVDYLIQTRIGKSKLLLMESNEPIQMISQKVGYQNSLSFTRAFKKIEGITPLDLRKAL